MTHAEILRSWLDPEFRASLGADAPTHPAGLALLDDADLAVAGGVDTETPSEEAPDDEVCAEEAGKTFFWSNRRTCIKCPPPSKPPKG